jgi:hypothetical protein
LRPRQRTARRRRLASINTPSFPGAREFCRAAIARNGPLSRGPHAACRVGWGARGKFLLNDAGAARQGPRRQVARQREAAWMRRSSPKGTLAKDRTAQADGRLDKETSAIRARKAGVTRCWQQAGRQCERTSKKGVAAGCGAGDGLRVACPFRPLTDATLKGSVAWIPVLTHGRRQRRGYAGSCHHALASSRGYPG